MGRLDSKVRCRSHGFPSDVTCYSSCSLVPSSRSSGRTLPGDSRKAASEDRSVICQPLDPVGCPEIAKALLNTLHHHIPDHLTGDSSCEIARVDECLAFVTQHDNLFGTNVAEVAWLRATGCECPIASDEWRPQLFPRAGVALKRRSSYEPIGNRRGRFFAEELSRFLNIRGAWSANHRPSFGIYR